MLFGGNAPLARLVFSPAGKIISRHGVLVFYIDVPMCSLGPAAPVSFGGFGHGCTCKDDEGVRGRGDGVYSCGTQSPGARGPADLFE